MAELEALVFALGETLLVVTIVVAATAVAMVLRYEKLWFLFYRYLRVSPGTTQSACCTILLGIKIPILEIQSHC